MQRKIRELRMSREPSDVEEKTIDLKMYTE